MPPTHRTPDGRLWSLLTLRGTVYAELWGATGNKRLRTTDLTNMEPLMPLHSRISDALVTVKALHKEAVADADNDPASELIASAMTDALTALETAVALGRVNQLERKE